MTPDEQLKTATADLINQTVTNMSSLQGWTLEQLPDVIHQLIMWNIVTSIGWMLVAIGITYLGWKPISNFFERMKEGRPEKHDYRTDQNDCEQMKWFIRIVALMISVPMFFINLFNVIKLVFMPKAWILEYAMTVLK